MHNPAMQITAWYRLTATGLEFNHFEDRLPRTATYPTPKHPNHAGWKNDTWVPFNAELIDDKVMDLGVGYMRRNANRERIPGLFRGEPCN